MATTNVLHRTDRAAGRPRISANRLVVVALTLATAAIHASLGGLLFTSNAIGYTILAVAMIAPGPIGQVRWLVRIALLGFAAATIGGWVLFGTRFPLAYLDKMIEIVLVAAVAVDLWRSDGGPIGVARQARGLAVRLAALRVVRVPR
jgi:hypothetical protein